MEPFIANVRLNYRFVRKIDTLLEILVLVGLPALLTGVTARVWWHQLSKPWLFVVLSGIGLYVLYALAFFLAAPSDVVSVDLFVHSPETEAIAPISSTQEIAVLLPLITAYLEPILFFFVAALPALWLAIKVCRK